MMLKKVLIGTMIASQVMTAQMAQAFTVSVGFPAFLKFLGGDKSELFVGHEEITRQALVITNAIIANDPESESMKKSLEASGILTVLKNTRYDEAIVHGAVSENPIIQGNYGTDMPASAKYPTMDASMRVENINRNGGVFGPNTAESGSFEKMIRSGFIYDKAGKQLALRDLSDQASFFIKVGIDTAYERMKQKLSLAIRGQSVSPSQKESLLRAARADLLLEVEKLAMAWGGDWHNNPEGQILHFLRNYKNPSIDSFGLETAADTCLSAREMIYQITKNALLKYPDYLVALKKKDPTAPDKLRQVLFLIGHATHMIQDSFSGEHTRRALSGMRDFGDTERGVLDLMGKRTAPEVRTAEINNDIIDICYYGDDQYQGMSEGGKKAVETCYHKYLAPDVATAKVMINSSMKGDFGDSIWTYGNRAEEALLKKMRFRFFTSKTDSDGLASSRKDNLFNRTEKNWAGSGKEGSEYVSRRAATDGGEPRNLERWAMINHNARLARSATAKYLYAVLRYMTYLNDAAVAAKTFTAGQFMEAIRQDTRVKGEGSLLDRPNLRGLLDTYFFEVPFQARSGSTIPSQIAAATKTNPWQNMKLPIEIMDTDGKNEYKVPVRPLNQIMPLGVFRCGNLTN